MNFRGKDRKHEGNDLFVRRNEFKWKNREVGKNIEILI